MPTERQEADTENQTERGQQRERSVPEVYRIREGVEEVLRERMRAETAPRGDIDPSRWTVDQRPFVWVATSKLTDDKVSGSPLWSTWRDVSQSTVTPLPYAPYASGILMLRLEIPKSFDRVELGAIVHSSS